MTAKYPTPQLAEKAGLKTHSLLQGTRWKLVIYGSPKSGYAYTLVLPETLTIDEHSDSRFICTGLQGSLATAVYSAQGPTAAMAMRNYLEAILKYAHDLANEVSAICYQTEADRQVHRQLLRNGKPSGPSIIHENETEQEVPRHGQRKRIATPGRARKVPA
jgi:hypothetical protein